MIETALHIVTPGAQAITTADGKQQIRVDYASGTDDTEIDNMILAATLQVEAFTGRVCMPTVYDLFLTGFPRGGIVLPISPVSEITSIKYYSDATTEVTWDAANYYYSIYEEPCKIKYVNGAAPMVYQYRSDAVTVRFTAGYADAATVPKSIRQAILLMLGDLYENRADVVREKFTLWQMTCYGERVIHTPNENAQ
jgi:uncharacterized phiE125 gp8 family phage protein